MSLTIDLQKILAQLKKKDKTDGDLEEAGCVRLMTDFLLHRVQWRAIERANGENYQDRLEWYEQNSPFEDIRALATTYLAKHRIRTIEPPAPETPKAETASV